MRRLAAVCELDSGRRHVYGGKNQISNFIYLYLSRNFIVFILNIMYLFVTCKFIKLKNIFNSKSFKKV